MQDLRETIFHIFKERKTELVEGVLPSDMPVAILFGGQAACGKSALTEKVNKEYPNYTFLNINGDNYRVVHPEYKILTHQPSVFSVKTQICSNVLSFHCQSNFVTISP